MRSILKLLSGRLFVAFVQCAAAVSFTIVAITFSPAASAQSSADAIYAVTYLDVGSGAVPQGIELLKKYRELSRRDAANLEFTVLQETSRPNRFVVMEGWKDQAAFEVHDKGAAKAEFLDALK